MKNDVLLSVIIPVYNVEKYLEECLDSLLLEMPEKCEIILVDDGSKDSSPDICDKYAKSDARIRVIHKENGGHSSARNYGLDIAIGKYVVFVDSDDFIGKNCLPSMLEWVRNNDEDLCFLNSFKYFSDGRAQILDVLPDRSMMKGKNVTESLKAIARCEKFPGSACGKMFKRSFLVKNDIYFPLDLLHGEDLTFMVKCYAYAEGFDYLDLDYYYYRQGREGSVTSCVDKTEICFDLAKFVKNTVEFSKVFPGKKDSLCSFAAYEYLISLSTYCLLSKDNAKKAKIFFKEYKYVLKYGTSKKMRVLRFLAYLLGIKITSILMRMWITVR